MNLIKINVDFIARNRFSTKNEWNSSHFQTLCHLLGEHVGLRLMYIDIKNQRTLDANSTNYTKSYR